MDRIAKFGRCQTSSLFEADSVEETTWNGQTKQDCTNRVCMCPQTLVRMEGLKSSESLCVMTFLRGHRTPCLYFPRVVRHWQVRRAPMVSFFICRTSAGRANFGAPECSSRLTILSHFLHFTVDEGRHRAECVVKLCVVAGTATQSREDQP